MTHLNEQSQQNGDLPQTEPQSDKDNQKETKQPENKQEAQASQSGVKLEEQQQQPESSGGESRPVERSKAPGRTGARGTAAMDPKTRQEVARRRHRMP